MLTCDDIAIIEELIRQRAGTSASPGFTWGRSGNSPDGTYLLHQGVPCNISAIPMALRKGVVTTLYFEQEDPLGFDFHLFSKPAPFTTIFQHTFAAATFGVYIIPVDQRPYVDNLNRLGVQILNGTAKNIIAGILAIGTA